MTADTPGPHCSNRLFEWTMALAMSGFGIHSLVLPVTLEESRYAGVLLVLSPTIIAAACVIIGVARIIALNRNGQWPEWGPWIRAAAAFAAGLVWTQLAVSLAQYSSPGMWIYFALAGAEFRSILRARRDRGDGSRHL